MNSFDSDDDHWLSMQVTQDAPRQSRSPPRLPAPAQSSTPSTLLPKCHLLASQQSQISPNTRTTQHTQLSINAITRSVNNVNAIGNIDYFQHVPTNLQERSQTEPNSNHFSEIHSDIDDFFASYHSQSQSQEIPRTTPSLPTNNDMNHPQDSLINIIPQTPPRNQRFQPSQTFDSQNSDFFVLSPNQPRIHNTFLPTTIEINSIRESQDVDFSVDCSAHLSRQQQLQQRQQEQLDSDFANLQNINSSDDDDIIVSKKVVPTRKPRPLSLSTPTTTHRKSIRAPTTPTSPIFDSMEQCFSDYADNATDDAFFIDSEGEEHKETAFRTTKAAPNNNNNNTIYTHIMFDSSNEERSQEDSPQTESTKSQDDYSQSDDLFDDSSQSTPYIPALTSIKHKNNNNNNNKSNNNNNNTTKFKDVGKRTTARKTPSSFTKKSKYLDDAAHCNDSDNSMDDDDDDDFESEEFAAFVTKHTQDDDSFQSQTTNRTDLTQFTQTQAATQNDFFNQDEFIDDALEYVNQLKEITKTKSKSKSKAKANNAGDSKQVLNGCNELVEQLDETLIVSDMLGVKHGSASARGNGTMKLRQKQDKHDLKDPNNQPREQPCRLVNTTAPLSSNYVSKYALDNQSKAQSKGLTQINQSTNPPSLAPPEPPPSFSAKYLAEDSDDDHDGDYFRQSFPHDTNLDEYDADFIQNTSSECEDGEATQITQTTQDVRNNAAKPQQLSKFAQLRQLDKQIKQGGKRYSGSSSTSTLTSKPALGATNSKEQANLTNQQGEVKKKLEPQKGKEATPTKSTQNRKDLRKSNKEDEIDEMFEFLQSAEVQQHLQRKQKRNDLNRAVSSTNSQSLSSDDELNIETPSKHASAPIHPSASRPSMIDDDSLFSDDSPLDSSQQNSHIETSLNNYPLPSQSKSHRPAKRVKSVFKTRKALNSSKPHRYYDDDDATSSDDVAEADSRLLHDQLSHNNNDCRSETHSDREETDLKLRSKSSQKPGTKTDQALKSAQVQFQTMPRTSKTSKSTHTKSKSTAPKSKAAKPASTSPTLPKAVKSTKPVKEVSYLRFHPGTFKFKTKCYTLTQSLRKFTSQNHSALTAVNPMHPNALGNVIGTDDTRTITSEHLFSTSPIDFPTTPTSANLNGRHAKKRSLVEDDDIAPQQTKSKHKHKSVIDDDLFEALFSLDSTQTSHERSAVGTIPNRPLNHETTQRPPDQTFAQAPHSPPNPAFTHITAPYIDRYSAIFFMDSKIAHSKPSLLGLLRKLQDKHFFYPTLVDYGEQCKEIIDYNLSLKKYNIEMEEYLSYFRNTPDSDLNDLSDGISDDMDDRDDVLEIPNRNSKHQQNMSMFTKSGDTKPPKQRSDGKNSRVYDSDVSYRRGIHRLSEEEFQAKVKSSLQPLANFPPLQRYTIGTTFVLSSSLLGGAHFVLNNNICAFFMSYEDIYSTLGTNTLQSTGSNINQWKQRILTAMAYYSSVLIFYIHNTNSTTNTQHQQNIHFSFTNIAPLDVHQSPTQLNTQPTGPNATPNQRQSLYSRQPQPSTSSGSAFATASLSSDPTHTTNSSTSYLAFEQQDLNQLRENPLISISLLNHQQGDHFLTELRASANITLIDIHPTHARYDLIKQKSIYLQQETIVQFEQIVQQRIQAQARFGKTSALPKLSLIPIDTYFSPPAQQFPQITPNNPPEVQRGEKSAQNHFDDNFSTGRVLIQDVPYLTVDEQIVFMLLEYSMRELMFGGANSTANTLHPDDHCAFMNAYQNEHSAGQHAHDDHSNQSEEQKGVPPNSPKSQKPLPFILLPTVSIPLPTRQSNQDHSQTANTTFTIHQTHQTRPFDYLISPYYFSFEFLQEYFTSTCKQQCLVGINLFGVNLHSVLYLLFGSKTHQISAVMKIIKTIAGGEWNPWSGSSSHQRPSLIVNTHIPHPLFKLTQQQAIDIHNSLTLPFSISSVQTYLDLAAALPQNAAAAVSSSYLNNWVSQFIASSLGQQSTQLIQDVIAAKREKKSKDTLDDFDPFMEAGLITATVKGRGKNSAVTMGKLRKQLRLEEERLKAERLKNKTTTGVVDGDISDIDEHGLDNAVDNTKTKGRRKKTVKSPKTASKSKSVSKPRAKAVKVTQTTRQLADSGTIVTSTLVSHVGSNTTKPKSKKTASKRTKRTNQTTSSSTTTINDVFRSDSIWDQAFGRK